MLLTFFEDSEGFLTFIIFGFTPISMISGQLPAQHGVRAGQWTQPFPPHGGEGMLGCGCVCVCWGGSQSSQKIMQMICIDENRESQTQNNIDVLFYHEPI